MLSEARLRRAKQRLRALCTEMMARIEEVERDDEFGHVGRLDVKAANCAAVLGFRYPPLFFESGPTPQTNDAIPQDPKVHRTTSVWLCDPLGTTVSATVIRSVYRSPAGHTCDRWKGMSKNDLRKKAVRVFERWLRAIDMREIADIIPNGLPIILLPNQVSAAVDEFNRQVAEGHATTPAPSRLAPDSTTGGAKRLTRHDRRFLREALKNRVHAIAAQNSGEGYRKVAKRARKEMPNQQEMLSDSQVRLYLKEKGWFNKKHRYRTSPGRGECEAVAPADNGNGDTDVLPFPTNN